MFDRARRVGGRKRLDIGARRDSSRLEVCCRFAIVRRTVGGLEADDAFPAWIRHGEKKWAKGALPSQISTRERIQGFPPALREASIGHDSVK